MKTLNSLLKYPVIGYSTLRSLNYLVQMQALSRVTRSLPFIKFTPPTLDKEKISLLQSSVKELLERDSENISQGYYPAAVLKPESFLEHWSRVPKLFFDGIKIQWRRQNNKVKSFDERTLESNKDLPDYYKRNFHFQTDGYLSEKSAELYEHQVELLFSGTADAMRRLMIKPLKEALRTYNYKPNLPLSFLEVACGTGRATRFMKLAFEAENRPCKITAADLSEPYLKLAQNKTSDLSGLHYIQDDAAQLSFKNEQFDIWYSVFLFHELPREVRQQVLNEAHRVLKPGGFIAIVDSLQLNDKENFDQFLIDFPKQFHEPFYLNYIQNPLEDLIKDCGFELFEKGHGFLSKFWVARKIEKS